MKTSVRTTFTVAAALLLCSSPAVASSSKIEKYESSKVLRGFHHLSERGADTVHVHDDFLDATTSTEIRFVDKLQNDADAFISDVKNWITGVAGDTPQSEVAVKSEFSLETKGDFDVDAPCGDLTAYKTFPVIKKFLDDPQYATLDDAAANSIMWHPSKTCVGRSNSVEVDGGSHVEFVATCGDQLLLNVSSANGGVTKTVFFKKVETTGAFVGVDFSDGDIRAVGATGRLLSKLKLRQIPDKVDQALKTWTQKIRGCAAQNKLEITGVVGGGWTQKYSRFGALSGAFDTYVLAYAESFKITYEALPTEAPIVVPPVTEAPTTQPPVTEAPTTDVPVLEPSTTPTPSATEAPETEVPKTKEPEIDAPTDTPTDAPTDALTDAPDTKKPDTEAPVTEEPATDEPTTKEPETEEPVTEGPETEEPDKGEPETEAPATERPGTEAPDTKEPVTETPASDAPETTEPETTEPTDTSNTTEPETDTPTDAPDTDAPDTEKPVSETEAPVETEVPTDAPETTETETKEPVTEAPADTTESETDAPTDTPKTTESETETPTDTPVTSAPKSETPSSFEPAAVETTATTDAPTATDAPTNKFEEPASFDPSTTISPTPTITDTDSDTPFAFSRVNLDLTRSSLKELSDSTASMYMKAGEKCASTWYDSGCFMNTAMSKAMNGRFGSVTLDMSVTNESSALPATHSLASFAGLGFLAAVLIAFTVKRTKTRRHGYAAIPSEVEPINSGSI